MMRRKIRLTLCALAAFASTLAASACSNPDSTNRAEVLASPAARRLIGAWNVSFRLDRSGTLVRTDVDTSSVTGTIVFVEDSKGFVSTDELTGPTHDGAYDIDFSRFGFTTRSAGDFPGAVARIADLTPRSDSLPRDSVQIVLSPGSQQFVVRMTGEMHGDTVAGVWSASTYRADAGSGHFVMKRQSQ